MEKMEAFFQKRVEEYDSHMLTEVVGCREGYCKMAQLLAGHRPKRCSIWAVGQGLNWMRFLSGSRRYG